MKADNPDHLTRKQIAARIGCSKELVRFHEQRGHLTAVRQSNGVVAYSKSEVEEFLSTFKLNKKLAGRRKLRADEGGAQLRKVLLAMKRGIQSVSMLILETGASPQIIARAKELEGVTASELVQQLRDAEAVREEKEAKRKRDRETFVYEKMRNLTLRARASGAK